MTDSGTSSQALHQVGEVLLPVQPLSVERSAAFHQQTGHLVLHPHRLLNDQVAITHQSAQIPQMRRQYVAGRQQVAPQQVGNGTCIDDIAFLLARSDGLHLGRMAHLQPLGIRLQVS